MSGRNHLKKNQNTPRPSEHPPVIKASTRMILVHVQKMYNIFRILIGVPDYSSSSSSFFVFFLNEEEAIPPGGKKYSGTIKAVHVQKMYKTCTEDVQYI